MIDVKIGKRKYECPEGWDEVVENKEQLLFVLKHLIEGVEKMDLQIFSVVEFLKLSAVQVARISEENFYRMSELLNFLSEKPLTIKKNIFPKLFKVKPFYCERSVLETFTVWEYALAEQSFFDYVESKKESDLDQFMAIIYRPSQCFWWLRKRFTDSLDRRTRFNDVRFNERIPRIARLPLALKYSVFLWFAHEKELIAKEFPLSFTKKIDDLNGGGGNWGDVILNMSEVGEEEKAANAKLVVVLRRIENMNRQAKEAEKSRQ